MKLLDNKYVKEIAPHILTAVVALAGNAIFTFEKKSTMFRISIIVFLLGLIAEIFLIANRIYKREQRNELLCESDEDIKNAMKRIIKMQGRVCIMSRDLTWVDEDVKACIISKASSILVFAEKETELTRELSENGVDVKYYGELNFEPKTRFTVVRYNARNPQVAIANTQNSIRKNDKIKHTIYQTKSGNMDEWINSLAVDMIQLCNTVCSGEKR